MKKLILLFAFLLSALIMSAQHVTNNFYYGGPTTSVTENREAHEYSVKVDNDFSRRIKNNNIVVYTSSAVATVGLATSLIGLDMMDPYGDDAKFERGSTICVVGICVFAAAGTAAVLAYSRSRSLRISRNLYFNGGSVTYHF